MSLGIVFKGPEGIVLAADSRVTLTVEMHVANKVQLLPSTFDNATKLLEFPGQSYVGAVTYGAGSMNQKQPRTAHSYIPELAAVLSSGRLSVQDMAGSLSEFFAATWADSMPADYQGPDMFFLVGGYNENEPYGRVYELGIPSRPVPVERNPGMSNFGISWGGQTEYTGRLLKGYDPRLPEILQQELGLDSDAVDGLTAKLNEMGAQIPYAFLPLQDCVDLAVFMIRTTMELQKWTICVRGVGGEIDVATVTRTRGFEAIRRKMIVA